MSGNFQQGQAKHRLLKVYFIRLHFFKRSKKKNITGLIVLTNIIVIMFSLIHSVREITTGTFYVVSEVGLFTAVKLGSCDIGAIFTLFYVT